MELTTVTRKSTCSMELGKTSKSTSFCSQAQRDYSSTNHALSAKTKPKLSSKNQAQSAEGLKQSSKAQKATRSVQRFQQSLRLKRARAECKGLSKTFRLWESTHKVQGGRAYTYGSKSQRTERKGDQATRLEIRKSRALSARKVRSYKDLHYLFL